jgi:2-oxoglutarate dehydrogenase E2 component (dihydrolipoamide succinyltransferase)
MAIDVKVPTVGETITSGILAAWLVKDGATVAQNQPLFSFETDKVTTDVNAPAAGILRIGVEAGQEVAVGQVVAGVEEAAAQPVAPALAEAPAQPAAPIPSVAAQKPAVVGQPGPAARRLAGEKGIDISTIEGTGKDGRATKGDIAAAAEMPAPQPVPVQQAPAPVPQPPAVQPAAAPAPASAAAPAAPKAPSLQAFPTAVNSQITESVSTTQPVSSRVTRKKMSPLRKRVAERLVRAKSEAAMLTTFNEVDMTAVMNLRKAHQEAFQKKHNVKLGFMSFFVKAVVSALKEVPQVNTQLDGDDIVENHFYDIGIAVGAPRGLVVPVVRDADTKSFAQIEKDIAQYGQKARDGKLTIDELQGGVFTITNGGIYGSLMSTPILNTPQSGILGMHAIKDRAVVVDGQVVARPMMYLALSYDHRVIDGKEAVTFLVKVKEAIEEPVRMLFEV